MKHREREIAVQGAQCLRRLGGSLNVSGTVQVQSHDRFQHDEERDQVGKSRANVRIDLDALQLSARLFRRLDQRLLTGCRALMPDFLRGLPEEEIRADGRPEHSHDRDHEETSNSLSRLIVPVVCTRWVEIALSVRCRTDGCYPVGHIVKRNTVLRLSPTESLPQFRLRREVCAAAQEPCSGAISSF